ncbi:AAA family ATPase [Vibrio parahaemolyticus]
MKLINNNNIILVGKNGSGKSRKLGEMAKREIDRNRNVITISTSLNDKYPKDIRKKNYHYMGARQGKNFFEKAIARAVVSLNRSKHPVQINSLLQVMKYAEFEEFIGFKVTGFINDFENIEFDSYNLSWKKKEEIKNILYAYRRINVNDEYGVSTHRVHKYSRFGSFSVLDSDNRYGESPSGEILAELLKNKTYLKRFGFLTDVEIFFCKRGDLFNELSVNDISSGEVSLIAMGYFLLSNMRENTIVFIDEPENSLHPAWQLNYLKHIRDLFPYLDFRCVIATHSPMIISGAIKEEHVVVFDVSNDSASKITIDSKGIEDAYIDQFGIVTPQNNSLSERCIDLINDVDWGKCSKFDAFEILNEFLSQSYDETQKKFISGVMNIVRDLRV